MTMLLPEFQLHQPESVEEVVELLVDHGPENCDILAGGSDLLCNYKWGLNARPHVIGLKRVSALKSIKPERIGAGVSLRELADDEVIRQHLPVLADTARKIASILIQEQATLGGNMLLDTRCHFFNQSYLWRRSLGYCLKADGDLCHVVPKIKRDGELVENRYECFATNSSDLLPVVIVLGGSFELTGPEGSRTVPAATFYKHDGIARFELQPNELLTAVTFPSDACGLKAGYKKLRPRESWDFPVLGVAAAIATNDDGTLSRFRLCVNAVDTHPNDFSDAVQDYVGKPLDDAAIESIASMIGKEVKPKLNVPMEPGYRKKMATVFTRRLLIELANND